jgi:rare lipoprotein A
MPLREQNKMRNAEMQTRRRATGHWLLARRNHLRATLSPLACSLISLSLLSACATHTPRPPTGSGPVLPPADVASIPEPIPKAEPRSALGNPPFYDVLGKRYFVLPSSAGFVERGIASWYGPGFHKERTSTGDPYDMYAMTAAHKTLPLPCYARVTNLNNGRSVVVYINDRGPFKDGRIVDLSYTAAAKLDILRAGTAPVELVVLSPSGSAANTSASPPSALFVQAGSFGEAANAQRLADKLRDAGYAQVAVRKDAQGSRALHRVRIGPLATVDEFDRIVAHLKSMGVSDARLATD